MGRISSWTGQSGFAQPAKNVDIFLVVFLILLIAFLIGQSGFAQPTKEFLHCFARSEETAKGWTRLMRLFKREPCLLPG